MLFVSYGAGVGVSDGPPNDESAVIHEPETILGEQIEVSGVVVSLDPVQIDIGHDDGSTGFVIENAPDDVSWRVLSERNEREPLLSSAQALYEAIRSSRDRWQHTANIARR